MPFSHIRALLCIHILSNCIWQFSEVQFSSECLHIFQYVKDGVKLDSDVLKSEPDDQYLFTNFNYTRIFYSYTPYQLSCHSSCPALFRLWHLKTTEIKIKSNLYPARFFTLGNWVSSTKPTRLSSLSKYFSNLTAHLYSSASSWLY